MILLPDSNSSKHERDKMLRKATSTMGWGLRHGQERPLLNWVASASRVGVKCSLWVLSVAECH